MPRPSCFLGCLHLAALLTITASSRAIEVPQAAGIAPLGCVALAADADGLYLANEAAVLEHFPAARHVDRRLVALSPDGTLAAHVAADAPDTVVVQRRSGEADSRYTFPAAPFADPPIVALSWQADEILKVVRHGHDEQAFQFLSWHGATGRLTPVGVAPAIGRDCVAAAEGRQTLCVNETQVTRGAAGRTLLGAPPRSGAPWTTVLRMRSADRGTEVATGHPDITLRIVAREPGTGAVTVVVHEPTAGDTTTRLAPGEWTTVAIAGRTAVLRHDRPRAARASTTLQLQLASETLGLYRYGRIAVLRDGRRSWLLATVEDDAGLQWLAAPGTVSARGFRPQARGQRPATEAPLTSRYPAHGLKPAGAGRRLLLADARGAVLLTVDWQRVDAGAPSSILRPAIRSAVRLPATVASRAGREPGEEALDWSCR